MLFWPRPRGLYLAPFPEECRGTLNIRVQPVSVSILNRPGVLKVVNDST